MKKLFSLLVVVLLVQGCSTVPDRTGQELVTEIWYESIKPGEVARHTWDPYTRMCRYTDGVIVNTGRDECPIRWKRKLSQS